MKKIASILFSALCLVACSKSDGAFDDWGGSPGGSFDEVPDSGEGSGNGSAGVLTAGEWSDLNNWPFWSSLMQDQQWYEKTTYWGFNPKLRVAVSLKDASDNAVANIPVKIFVDGVEEFAAVSDNHGNANLWLGFFDAVNEFETDGKTLEIKVDGKSMDGEVLITRYSDEGLRLNSYTVASSKKAEESVDVAFVVDATGSMGDEIDFLKEDLLDIINKASANDSGVQLRTSAVFYRDEGDEYVTKFRDFTTDHSLTRNYVKDQRASGGGDYPEAVHTALETTLQKLSWNEQAKSRVVFMFLDAPAHHTDNIIASMQKSISDFARSGISIIPIAASGVDKNTEFMLRYFSIATGGTYVFLTNDSGVGLDHIEPTVGEIKVENLNSLIVRLIADRM